MARRRFLVTAIVTAAAILSLSATIVGVDRSTDNRTPQSQLTYDVFADGQRIASMTDNGGYSGVYSIQHLTHTGPNTITVKAVDAAGNRSAPSTGPARPTS
jgi:hypothetical protein